MHQGYGVIFARLRELARQEAVKPPREQRIILEITAANTALWRDPHNPLDRLHTTLAREIRRRIRRLRTA